MAKTYLSTLLFFPRFSRILPFYPAIIPFKYFPVFLPYSPPVNLPSFVWPKLHYMNNHVNIFQGCPVARSCMKLILLTQSYKFQPICDLNLATYNPLALLISAKTSQPVPSNKESGVCASVLCNTLSLH
uniref:Uncharacterized protein n=1 Tax=Sinocyclocheilus rhinocerous TaxID=307959 RepID=A0A673FIQ1_9TELE